MENQITYLTQYCDFIIELHNQGIGATNINKSQSRRMQELFEKTLCQSSLTPSELSLISICRRCNIFKKVNIYALKLLERHTM